MTYTSNAHQVAANVNAMSERLGNPQPALEQLRQDLVEQEAQVWVSEGATLGTHWPPSADPERKVDSRLLVATGALRASLADPSAGQVVGDRLEFGTDVPYGRYHQYGTSRTPQRQFLGVSPAVARQVTDRLSELIAEDVR